MDELLSQESLQKLSQLNISTLDKITRRAQALAMNMIYVANHRDDIQKGDPKVGGHPSASSSALHILSALHLVYKKAHDFMCNKPHASPTDHAFNYLLSLFREDDGALMSEDRSRLAMKNLRHFSLKGEPVFQSYHAEWDPDSWNMLPSGSVGIPPVQALYLAEAFNMAEKQNRFNLPKNPHFWCLMGDSEFREGSLLEALPEASERGIGNLTWIVDYNRQSLDGYRTFAENDLGDKDCDRIEKTCAANGWDVLQIKHGSFRKKIFNDSKNGDALRNILEEALPDAELQSLLMVDDAKVIISALSKYDTAATAILKDLQEVEVKKFIHDLGGHDILEILKAYELSALNVEKPTMIIPHTIKGWGLDCIASAGNHSAMMGEEEVLELLKSTGAEADLFAFSKFSEKSEEGKFLKIRSTEVYSGIQKVEELKEQNQLLYKNRLAQTGWNSDEDHSLDINLKFLPVAHTQWMLGQLTAKLNRIGDTPLESQDEKKQLKDSEKKWKAIGENLITMAPDVGTSTNLNASMDGKTFGPDAENFNEVYGVLDKKIPNIAPNETESSRHLRFEIAEANAMSCMGSFGKLAQYMGVPFIPVMTVYDFFIKRALDQLFYDCYWGSHFILVGTPSGVTLSPEGAQHGWKSDIQIANMITWEPAFALEFDWVFSESLRRHVQAFEEDYSGEVTKGRSAVVIRAVTRAIDQKLLLKRLKKHSRFEGLSDESIFAQTKEDALQGAYYIVDYRSFENYQPSENVVNIFSMGSLVTEALAASDELLKEGVYANVIQVSCPDLLVGPLAEEKNYQHLKENLQIQGDLYLSKKTNSEAAPYPPRNFAPARSSAASLSAIAARRVPVVSVHDGESGLLDNIGSCLGTLQKTLAVKKHSKCGRPVDIYAYHKIDAQSVAEASREILKESALSSFVIDESLLK